MESFVDIGSFADAILDYARSNREGWHRDAAWLK